MIAATLFSGIGAPEVAMPAWDWRWHAEIEPFPAAVMAARHPESVNLGDATAHDFTARAAALGPVDVVVFGSPCQSYSIAGKRLGLDDPRGHLALIALRILGILRPRWFVFENVPGLLSSWSGAEDDPDEGIDACTQSSDFDAFRGHVDNIGYSGAWAVLDAQFFGVAQRRRRVFFVGHLGPDWRRPAAVLLEPDRVCGDSPARGRARKDVAGTLRAGAENGGCGPTVDDAAAGQLIVHTLRGEGFDASEDGTGRGVPLVVDSNQITSRVNRSQPARDMTHTLPVAANSPLVFGPVTATYAKTVSRGSKNAGAMDNHVIEPVAYALGSHASCADGEATNRSHASGGPVGLGISEDVAHCLRAGRVQAVAMSGVRRLMPIECERLQGFPDVREIVTLQAWREAEKRDHARSVALHSAAQSHAPSVPVAVHALIDSERTQVQIHSHGRLLWSASDAELSSSSPLPMPLGDFVRLAAHTNRTLAQAIRAGRAVSPLNISGSSRPLNGSVLVHLSGTEIAALASDAERFTSALRECSRFITSGAGPSSPHFASILETSCSCVAAAIAAFIPAETRLASSYALSVEVVTPYTLIPYRGKPAKDGPRYRAIGNSMAVPVIRWILERIEWLDTHAPARSEVA